MERQVVIWKAKSGEGLTPGVKTSDTWHDVPRHSDVKIGTPETRFTVSHRKGVGCAQFCLRNKCRLWPLNDRIPHYHGVDGLLGRLKLQVQVHKQLFCVPGKLAAKVGIQIEYRVRLHRGERGIKAAIGRNGIKEHIQVADTYPVIIVLSTQSFRSEIF